MSDLDPDKQVPEIPPPAASPNPNTLENAIRRNITDKPEEPAEGDDEDEEQAYEAVNVTVTLVMKVRATDELTPTENAESIVQRIFEDADGSLQFGDFSIEGDPEIWASSAKKEGNE